MSLKVSSLKKMMVPALSAGLLMGIAGMSQAQNFNFTNNFASNVFISNTSGTGATTLTVSNGSSAITTGAPTFVSLGNVGITTVTGGGPNTYNAANGTFNATFTLTDVGLNQSRNGVISGFFSGQADGGVGGNSPSSTVFATFTSAPLVFVFSNGTYTVGAFSQTPPGAANNTPGALSALVTYTPVPEPGSVAMLVGIGVSGAGFLVRRRRK